MRTTGKFSLEYFTRFFDSYYGPYPAKDIPRYDDHGRADGDGRHRSWVCLCLHHGSLQHTLQAAGPRAGPGAHRIASLCHCPEHHPAFWPQRTGDAQVVRHDLSSGSQRHLWHGWAGICPDHHLLLGGLPHHPGHAGATGPEHGGGRPQPGCGQVPNLSHGYPATPDPGAGRFVSAALCGITGRPGQSPLYLGQCHRCSRPRFFWP